MQRAIVVLVVAAVSLGATSAQEPFTEEALLRGINYTVGNPVGFGAGVAFADLDGDGDPDIIVLGRETSGEIGVYENDGTGFFTDHTATSGIPSLPEASGVTAADYDGDGDRDLYFSCYRSVNMLMRNDGGFSFTNQTTTTRTGDPGAGEGCAWADYDGDGWLDLYLGNRTDEMSPEPNRLFRNQGNGTFQDVASDLGVDRGDDLTFHVNFFDYDRNGTPDLYVCNDKGRTCSPFVNHLFQNNGGTFVDVTVPTDTEACVDCMGTGVGDIDGNGYQDLYCTNLFDPSVLLMNQDATNFVESAAIAGVESGAIGWGNIFFDYDNDSYLDIYVNNLDAPDRLYENDGVWPCTDIADTVGLGGMSTNYVVSAADIDDDGDLDLMVSGANDRVRLFINQEGDNRNWLKVKLLGVAPNTHAVGARVETVVGAQTQLREVFSGIGFKSDWPSVLHFGMDDATVVDEIQITWPDGNQGSYYGDAVNQTVVFDQRDVDFDRLFGPDDNCPTVANPDQDNLDDDPAGDACDCAQNDTTRWNAPTEVRDLRLHHDLAQNLTTLTWTAPDDPGATTVWYDVLKSTDPTAFTSGTCVESDDGTDTEATDSEMPGPGGLYYLVRAENNCPAGVGPLGTDSNGDGRVGTTCP